MKWSWRLGEVAGIGIFVHATFLILIAWIALASWTQGQTVAAVVVGVGFILALFGCIFSFSNDYSARIAIDEGAGCDAVGSALSVPSIHSLSAATSRNSRRSSLAGTPCAEPDLRRGSV